MVSPSQIINVPYFHDNSLVYSFFHEDESTIKETTYMPKDRAPIESTKDVWGSTSRQSERDPDHADNLDKRGDSISVSVQSFPLNSVYW